MDPTGLASTLSPEEAAGAARGERRRILFVAEAVTLAHVARPVALARSLDRSRYEAILATSPRFAWAYRDLRCPIRPIDCLEPGRFLDALSRGRPLYDREALRGYVRQDLEVLEETRPDVVIGDFRLSLAVSARLARVPYLAIANAYWSPYARGRFPMPELPMSRRLGVPLARVAFRLARPVAFALHARPLNRVRREYGQAPLGLDLRRVYTEADYTLYADCPELVPISGLPAHHRYLGPIRWSPDVERPDWWSDLPEDRPIVYVSLGSSGRGDLLPVVFEALAGLDVTVMASTLRPAYPERVPPNVRVAPLLPGREAASRARLVICNGGSPATHQALDVGVPVLGIVGNMDQHLNMGAIRAYGAGASIRTEHASAARIRRVVERLLRDPTYPVRAARLAEAFRLHDPSARLAAVLREVCPARGS